MLDSLARSAKAWFGALVTGCTALEVGLADNVLTKEEVLRAVVATVIALGVVYNVANAGTS
jgi:hypothetical protein